MIDKKIHDLLYTNDSGEEIGLYEVQLLESKPLNRIRELIELLGSKDLYLSYQATLILAAWGIKEGIEKIKEFVQDRIDSKAEFEPHRIWDEDNVYDVMSDALYIAILSGYNKREIFEIFRDILKLYGEKFFESKLKYALMDLNDDALLSEIKVAMDAALKNKKFYQASQLLPVLAKYDKAYAANQISAFRKLISKDQRISHNIEETEEFI